MEAVDDFEEFFTKSNCKSKLIFCEDEDVEEIIALLPDDLQLMEKVDEDDIEVIRSL